MAKAVSAEASAATAACSLKFGTIGCASVVSCAHDTCANYTEKWLCGHAKLLAPSTVAVVMDTQTLILARVDHSAMVASYWSSTSTDK